MRSHTHYIVETEKEAAGSKWSLALLRIVLSILFNINLLHEGRRKSDTVTVTSLFLQ